MQTQQKKGKTSSLGTVMCIGGVPKPDQTWLNDYATQYKIEPKALWAQVLVPLFIDDLRKLSEEERKSFEALSEDARKEAIQPWAELPKTRTEVTWRVGKLLGEQALVRQIVRRKELIERPCEVEKLREENQELKRQLAPLTNKLRKQEKELGKLFEVNKTLRKENKRVQGLLDGQHDANAKLEYEKEQLRVELQTARVEIQRLVAQTKTMSQGEGREEHKTPQPVLEEKKSAEGLFSEARKTLSRLFVSPTRATLEKAIKRLEEENDDLRSENADLNGRLLVAVADTTWYKDLSNEQEYHIARLIGERNALQARIDLVEAKDRENPPTTEREPVTVIEEASQGEELCLVQLDTLVEQDEGIDPVPKEETPEEALKRGNAQLEKALHEASETAERMRAGSQQKDTSTEGKRTLSDDIREVFEDAQKAMSPSKPAEEEKK